MAVYFRAMQPDEPILLICHSFPPHAGIGGRRWAKFAKALARRGHPVHVIHSAAVGGEPISPWLDDVRHPGIISHPLPARYPKAFTRLPATTPWHKLQYAFWARVLPFCTKGTWYDRGLFWRPGLLRLATGLIRKHGIRNVIVTGAPFSLMVYAAELKKEFPEIHLVSDFRDAWTWGNYYGFDTINKERIQHEKTLEAMVARTSDKLTSPHADVIEHLRGAHGILPERLALLPHAIDPEDMQVEHQRTAEGSFRMIYAGSLYESAETDHYFEMLLHSFKALHERSPEAFANCRLDLYITEQGTEGHEQLVKDLGLGRQVYFHAPLPAKEIFREIAASDLHLSFIPSVRNDVFSTKFNEVFFLGVPILHVGGPGLVRQTILERRMGSSITVEELVDELPRIITGERKVESDKNADHGAYLLPNVTDRLISDVLA